MSNVTPQTRNHNAPIYRTAHFNDEQVEKLQQSANKQFKEIGEWFMKHPKRTIGPGRLHKLLNPSWPITSTRRAIHNLTDAGLLTMTDKKAEGIYGRAEHQWKWRNPNKRKAGKQADFFQEAVSWK